MSKSNRSRVACVLSEPVQVSVDELIGALLRKYPEEEVAEILRVSVSNATQRTKRSRHNRYKAERFFRRAAEKLVNVPDDLAIAVGLNEQLPLFPIKEEAGPVSQEEPEEPVAKAVLASEEEAPSIDDEESLLTAIFDAPTFQDVRGVFNRYPYIEERHDPREGRLLLLGYASARNAEGNLVRRNCAIVRKDGEQTVFRNIQGGVYPLIQQKTSAVHKHVKLMHYPKEPFGVRFWTHVETVGDIQDLYRFVVVSENGIRAAENHHDMMSKLNPPPLAQWVRINGNGLSQKDVVETIQAATTRAPKAPLA